MIQNTEEDLYRIATKIALGRVSVRDDLIEDIQTLRYDAPEYRAIRILFRLLKPKYKSFFESGAEHTEVNFIETLHTKEEI